MYWPAGGRGSSAEFGGIHVTLLYEDVRAAYTVRHLRVKCTMQMVCYSYFILVFFLIYALSRLRQCNLSVMCHI